MYAVPDGLIHSLEELVSWRNKWWGKRKLLYSLYGFAESKDNMPIWESAMVTLLKVATVNHKDTLAIADFIKGNDLAGLGFYEGNDGSFFIFPLGEELNVDGLKHIAEMFRELIKLDKGITSEIVYDNPDVMSIVYYSYNPDTKRYILPICARITDANGNVKDHVSPQSNIDEIAKSEPSHFPLKPFGDTYLTRKWIKGRLGNNEQDK